MVSGTDTENSKDKYQQQRRQEEAKMKKTVAAMTPIPAPLPPDVIINYM